MNKDLKIVFVVGPTASGKSDLALHLAKKFNGSIANIDSVQFYEGLVIGSAAPTEDEKKQVPHYLFSYVKAPAEMTAGQYIRDFYNLIEKEKTNSPIFVVGGTGFYIQALEKGMYALPEVSEEIKEQVLQDFKTKKSEDLFAELKDFDPETTLHPNDHYRVGRALEVKRAFKQKMSDFKSAEIENKNQLPFPYIKIGLTFENEKNGEKEKFTERVQQRTLSMLKKGLVAETKSFIDKGFKDWAPLASVGYNEVKDYLMNQTTEGELPGQITAATMKLVKKQRTWFKRDETIIWGNVFNTEKSFFENHVTNFLNQKL